jgi:hypothetical protein
LKQLWQRSGFVLLVAAFTISCAHRVDVRPNEPVGGDLKQTLIVANETSQTLELLPALTETSTAKQVIQPGQKTRVDFTVRLERNQSAGREQEVVLVPEKSSPYLTQSAIDLMLKARFGSGPQREIRVRLGPCLFAANPSATEHDLHLARPPLSGVPALQLCP